VPKFRVKFYEEATYTWEREAEDPEEIEGDLENGEFDITKMGCDVTERYITQVIRIEDDGTEVLIVAGKETVLTPELKLELGIN
jgi:hypothetical protein